MPHTFCTLAIGAPYRTRAKLLCADLAPHPCMVLTDEPEDFRDMPWIRAKIHLPTGPMAEDYLRRPEILGSQKSTAAYHDKRFVIEEALADHGSCIFIDADTRLVGPWPSIRCGPGLSIAGRKRTIHEHLLTYGPERRPFFEMLADDLDISVRDAFWCSESCYAVVDDGKARAFLDAWDYSARFLQDNDVFSGEGGVMGLCAAHAKWVVDFEALAAIQPILRHEGGGPKR